MTIEIDYTLEGLAYRQKRLPPRKKPVRGVIVHTTGAGPWVRWFKNRTRFRSPYDAARHIYHSISPYCGHYLVCGETGNITQLVPTNVVAWHVGSKRSWRYRLPGWAKNKGFGWWFTRFARKGPRGLMDGSLWGEGSANAISVGIEVAPPKAGPRAEWSDECWQSISLLVDRLTSVYQFPRDRFHVVTHSDAHPLARSRKDGSPWDPSPRQWRIGLAIEKLGLT